MKRKFIITEDGSLEGAFFNSDDNLIFINSFDDICNFIKKYIRDEFTPIDESIIWDLDDWEISFSCKDKGGKKYRIILYLIELKKP